MIPQCIVLSVVCFRNVRIRRLVVFKPTELCMKCSWRKCPSGVTIAAGDARVDVRCKLPRRFKVTPKGKRKGQGRGSASQTKLASFQVDWQVDGSAVFHDKCYSSLRSRKVKSKLDGEEKKLFGQAHETAEYFDSSRELDAKARRLVKMLQSSKHAVVFTGAGIS